MYSEKLVNTGNMKMGRCRYGGANKELRDAVGYADTDWDRYRQIENVHRLNGQITKKSCVSYMCLLHVPDHVQLGSARKRHGAVSAGGLEPRSEPVSEQGYGTINPCHKKTNEVNIVIQPLALPACLLCKVPQLVLSHFLA